MTMFSLVLIARVIAAVTVVVRATSPGAGSAPTVIEEDKDTDFVCCDIFNATHPPPRDWRKRYPASAPGINATGRNDTVPAYSVTQCIGICKELFPPRPEGIRCRAAAWNAPQRQCYLKWGKANPQPKVGDTSFLLGDPTSPGSDAVLASPISVTSLDGATTVQIDSVDGNVVAVGPFGDNDPTAPSSTMLFGCVVIAVRVAAAPALPAAVRVERNFTCDRAAAMVTVVDTFAPASRSVEWNTTVSDVRTKGSCFSVPIVSTVDFASANAVYAPFTRGCVANAGNRAGPVIAGLCAGTWRNPLAADPAPAAGASRFYRLGSMPRMPSAAAAVEPGVVGPFSGLTPDDSFSVPVTTVMREEAGATFALSPSDPLLDVVLQINGTAAGATRVAWWRLFLRFCDGDGAQGGARLAVTAHLAARRDAGWRPALALYEALWPEYMRPHDAEYATKFDGLGSYSWYTGDGVGAYNSTRRHQLGFATNWDLSGTFMPYDPLFLPYQKTWENLGGINAGLRQYNVTLAHINQYYVNIQKAGFHSLSYFLPSAWGVQTNLSKHWPAPDPNACGGPLPNGLPVPCPTVAGANAYLQHYMQPAMLREGWDFSGAFNRSEWLDWVGPSRFCKTLFQIERRCIAQLRARSLIPAKCSVIP